MDSIATTSNINVKPNCDVSSNIVLESSNNKLIESQPKHILRKNQSQKMVLLEDVSLLSEAHENTISEIINIVLKATEEVISLISDECSIILECKMCNGWFRSFSIFRNHKNSACMDSCTRNNCDQHKVNILYSRSTTKSDVPTIIQQTSLKFLLKGIGYNTEDFMEFKGNSSVNSICLNKDLFKQRYTLQEKQNALIPIPANTYVQNRGSPTELQICKSIQDQECLQGIEAISQRQCPHCKKCFASVRNCNRHVRNVHAEFQRIQKTRNYTKKRESNLKCKSRKMQLTSPLLTQYEEKTFLEDLRNQGLLQQCQGCFRSFQCVDKFCARMPLCKNRLPTPQSLIQSLKRKSLLPSKIVYKKKSSSNSDCSMDVSNEVASDHVETIECNSVNEKQFYYIVNMIQDGTEISLNADETLLNSIHRKFDIEYPMCTSDSDLD